MQTLQTTKKVINVNNEIIKVRLENPIEGYEIDAEYRTPKIGESIAIHGDVFKVQNDLPYTLFLVLTPKIKKYDWSKTDQDCLVYLGAGDLCRFGDALEQSHTALTDIKAVNIYDGWQALTFPSEIPIDECAVDVEYRKYPGGPIFVEFSSASGIAQYRVTGLKPGYKY